MDDGLRAQLKRAVRARLEGQRPEIEQALSSRGFSNLLTQYMPIHTWVEAGQFGGDVQVSWKKLTINTPQLLQFRWHTEEPNAARGV